VIRAHIQDLLPEDTYLYDPATEISDLLMRVAMTHAHIDCDPKNVGTFRAILSDCRQGNPRYGKLLWEEGPTRTHKLMERLLEQAVDDGKLEIENVAQASVQFLALIKGDLVLRRMFGCDGCQDAFASEVESNARAGVSTFLRAYLPR